MSVWSMNFSMMIGLAVGIDYSLFIVSRYREERAEGKDAIPAIENTMSTAGKAVFLSALTVVLSLAAVFLVPVMVFRSMALGMILSVVAVASPRSRCCPRCSSPSATRCSSPGARRIPTSSPRAAGPAGRASPSAAPARCSRSAWCSSACSCFPALGMRLGMPGARVVDPGRTSRDGYELVVKAFGPGAAAPAFVTVPAADANTVVEIAAADRNVVDASVVTEPAATGGSWCGSPRRRAVDDSATGATIDRLRTELDAAVPAAKVGGPAAQNRDLTGVLTGARRYAIGVILIVAFVLLLVVFRSLVVALFSIAMNLLTVGAAFGFATVVFQHGVGAGLLGIQHQGFVDAWAPLFFFALLFGLSMDYQLFLLAAIRERYQATGDTNRAIKEGIARTGRPITNAALIMIVVFVAFGITGPIPPTELGVTLAMAVLLDATVVRVMLVPATMALLGERNWYVPKWLARILPDVHFSH